MTGFFTRYDRTWNPSFLETYTPFTLSADRTRHHHKVEGAHLANPGILSVLSEPGLNPRQH